VKSAIKTRAAKNAKKVPMATRYREVLAHVKCNDNHSGVGYSYDLMLYGEQYHWADDERIFTIAHCDSEIVSGLKQSLGDKQINPEQGLILRVYINEAVIASRRQEPLAIPGFLAQTDIKKVSLHESEGNAHLICLIGQLPEAECSPVKLTAKEGEMDDPF